MEKCSASDIKLLKSREGKEATIEFYESYPDGYCVKIIAVNKDGTFTCQLLDVVPCM